MVNRFTLRVLLVVEVVVVAAVVASHHNNFTPIICPTSSETYFERPSLPPGLETVSRTECQINETYLPTNHVLKKM